MRSIAIVLPLLAAFTGFSVWNYRRFMPAPKVLGREKYKVKVEKMPVSVSGRQIYGELLLPEGKQGKLPVVICCHGYGSSYKLTKNAIGKSLAMSGYAAYCFDFCGGSKKSKSSGSFSEMTIFKEKDDLLAVIDTIKKSEWADSERLYLLGESQGGMVAAITVVDRREDIKAMVLYYPAFCIPDDAHKKFAGKEDIPEEVKAFTLTIGGDYYRSVWDFDVFDYISGYQGPVLIMHGDHDQVVDISYGRKGAESYKNAEFITFPGEIHGFYGKGKSRAVQMSYDFFQKQAGHV